VAVVAELAGSERVVVRTGASAASFRYLVSATGGGSWATRWEGAIAYPLAIGVLAQRDDGGTDTMVVRLGAHD
jgi:hypothetical protein